MVAIKRPVGDSCLGWEGAVGLGWHRLVGCPVTWSQGVQLGPNPCYSLGNTSLVWPGYACLKSKKCKIQEKAR